MSCIAPESCWLFQNLSCRDPSHNKLIYELRRGNRIEGFEIFERNLPAIAKSKSFI